MLPGTGHLLGAPITKWRGDLTCCLTAQKGRLKRFQPQFDLCVYSFCGSVSSDPEASEGGAVCYGVSPHDVRGLAVQHLSKIYHLNPQKRLLCSIAMDKRPIVCTNNTSVPVICILDGRRVQ